MPQLKPSVELLADEDEDNWNTAPLYETLNEEEFEEYMDKLAELGRGLGGLPNSAFDREALYDVP